MAATEAGILKKKESLLSLEPLLNRNVEVMCIEFRTVHGILKGFDSNMNIVLANAFEDLRRLDDHALPRLANGQPLRRALGACIVRGGSIMSVCPTSGFHEIQDPFA